MQLVIWKGQQNCKPLAKKREDSKLIITTEIKSVVNDIKDKDIQIHLKKSPEVGNQVSMVN